jgi:hypothetical protein
MAASALQLFAALADGERVDPGHFYRQLAELYDAWGQVYISIPA